MGPNRHRPLTTDEGRYEQLASSAFLFSSFLGNIVVVFFNLILAFKNIFITFSDYKSNMCSQLKFKHYRKEWFRKQSPPSSHILEKATINGVLYIYPD